ncbi:MAG TPA: apolipoprotein N-acyltransferase [Candidatus Latescibacteria bacterium]|nr:apolipoprotein N-acyltransferase [Candidatus Latescibacterota bacterium]
MLWRGSRSAAAERLDSTTQQWTPQLLGRFAHLVAGALSGLLYGLSLPKADLGGLAWISLFPVLIFAVREQGPSSGAATRALASGLVFGIVACTFRVYWIVETLGLYGGLNQSAAVATTALLILYLALYPMLFVGSLHLTRPGYGFAWLAAAAWALLDWVQTWMLSGFPWAVLGTTQYQQPQILHFAALAGVHGLSFLIVAVNAGLAQLLFAQRGKQRLAGAIAVLLPATLILSWSAFHQRALEAERTGDPIRIGIVQGNIHQDVKWNPQRAQSTTRKYVDLTRRLAHSSGPLDLILWPETALPFHFDDDSHAIYRDAVRKLAMEIDTPLLVGSLGTSSVEGHPGLFNRSFLIGRDGGLQAYGDKVHLVPFGEYLPLPWLFNYMQELTAQSGRFDPGKQHAVIPLRDRGPNMGLFICYESIFPSITRELARRGAGFLVNTTNDAWFGVTAAPYQHFAMVVLRAVETGRPIVRAANTGISGEIAADGRVELATKLLTTDTVIVELSPRMSLTPYVRYGDVVFVLSGGIWGGFLLLFIGRRRSAVLREMADASTELESLAAHPQSLQRPLVLLPGYASTTAALHVLRFHLERCFTETSGRILDIDLGHDLSLTELVSAAASALPQQPCDYVGHSLGGLVASGLARDGDDVPWVFALAAPFHGTRMASVPSWVRSPYPTLLADLGRNSEGLKSLARRTRQLRGFRAIHLLGDPLRPGLASVPLHTYQVPMLLGPLQRHRAVHADPRVIRDIVVALRSRP